MVVSVSVQHEAYLNEDFQYCQKKCNCSLQGAFHYLATTSYVSSVSP